MHVIKGKEKKTYCKNDGSLPTSSGRNLYPAVMNNDQDVSSFNPVPLFPLLVWLSSGVFLQQCIETQQSVKKVRIVFFNTETDDSTVLSVFIYIYIRAGTLVLISNILLFFYYLFTDSTTG